MFLDVMLSYLMFQFGNLIIDAGLRNPVRFVKLIYLNRSLSPI